MRIGILTFHTAHNYGAVLQCYALKEYLTIAGNDVYIIDYQSEHIMKAYKTIDYKRFVSRNPIRMLQSLYSEIKYYGIRKLRSKVFREFVGVNLPTASTSDIASNPFDLIIIGSDQVWNFNLTHGFDSYYWGSFSKPNRTRLASYAASMQDNWPQSYDDTICTFLSSFDYLSVREQSIGAKLSSILGCKKIEHVVDPTLLLTSAQWERIVSKPPIKDKYLFLYQVEENELAYNIARDIAKERGLRLIFLSARSDGVNTNIIKAASPNVFLGLFKFADYVVCSSFHGTIFSLVFKRPFISIKMNTGKDARVSSLLGKLSLLDRFVDKKVTLQDEYTIDDQVMNTLRVSSFNYLNLITNK